MEGAQERRKEKRRRNDRFPEFSALRNIGLIDAEQSQTNNTTSTCTYLGLLCRSFL